MPNTQTLIGLSFYHTSASILGKLKEAKLGLYCVVRFHIGEQRTSPAMPLQSWGSETISTTQNVDISP